MIHLYLSGARTYLLWKSVFYIVAVLFITVTARAQIASGSIRGTIVDSIGVPVYMANVILKEENTGLIRGTAAAEDGTYNIIGLPPGVYEVTASQVAYEKFVYSNIKLLIGQTLRVNFKLRSATIKLGEIEISGQRVPPVEINRIDISAPVRQEQIQNLPLNDRNFISLAALAPGMRSYPGGVPSYGAFDQYRFINVYIDGAQWKNRFNGNTMGNVQGGVVPQDAIQEFRVLTSAYDAEYGRGGAYVVFAVTKRGSNEFHGDAFYNMRDKSLNTRGPFEIVKPAYKRVQTGISLSGPIIENRLFYAVTYERSDLTTFIQTTPRQPSYNPSLWSAYNQAEESPWTDNSWVVRLTGQLFSNNTFDLIWDARRTNGSRFWGGLRPKEGGIVSNQNVDNVLLKDAWVPSQNTLNELTLQYISWRVFSDPRSTAPMLQYPGIILGGNVTAFPLHMKEYAFRVIDNFTYMKDNWAGDHIFKAGVEFALPTVDVSTATYQAPAFYFKTDTSSLPYQAIMSVGLNDRLGTSDARAVSHASSLGLFVQDTWNPIKTLTLNLGIRWDADFNALNNGFISPLAKDTTITNNIDPRYIMRGNRKNDLSDFAPRVGFSWDVFGTGRTSVRGGFGLFYDRVAYNYTYNEIQSVNWIQYTILNPGTMDPAKIRDMILSGKASAQPNVTLMDINIKNPYVREFSIGFSHYVTSDVVVSLDYVNDYGINYYSNYTVNYYEPSTKKRTITPKYGNISLWGNFGTNFYQGLLLGITKPYQDGWMLQVSYALSGARSEMDDPVSGYTFLSSFKDAPSLLNNLHRLTVNWILDLPVGFQFSGILNLASPTPYAVTIGQDINNDNNYGDDWPNDLRNSGTNDIHKIRNWFKNVDLSVKKNFQLMGVTLQMRVDAFNAFNWYNAAGYAGRMGDAKGSPYTNFGQATSAYPPRQVQIGARVKW
ncbi:MAG: TonB-dependent receptor [Ignavibacteriaceae bacterium]